MTKPSNVFKHPIIVELVVVAIVAIAGSYLTILQASIPRSEVEMKIEKSEEKQMNVVERLDMKQDLILDKLELLQVEVGTIKGKLEEKERK